MSDDDDSAHGGSDNEAEGIVDDASSTFAWENVHVVFGREGDATVLTNKLSGNRVILPPSAHGGYNIGYGDSGALEITHADSGEVYDRVCALFHDEVTVDPELKQVYTRVGGGLRQLAPETFRIEP